MLAASAHFYYEVLLVPRVLSISHGTSPHDSGSATSTCGVGPGSRLVRRRPNAESLIFRLCSLFQHSQNKQQSSKQKKCLSPIKSKARNLPCAPKLFPKLKSSCPLPSDHAGNFEGDELGPSHNPVLEETRGESGSRPDKCICQGNGG